MYSGVTEPFCVGRDAEVLLFDFSIVLSCMKKNGNLNVLDFAGGTGWVAELLNRAGYNVTIFDIDPGFLKCVELRIQADARVDSSRFHAQVSDGHKLEFCDDGYFGNIICYDSLHHMHDFESVVNEMYRVLAPEGRASFTEPGAKHADSEETKEFIRKHKSYDPHWIEKSIYLEEINEIACRAGFRSLRVKPFLLPSMVDFSYDDWRHFGNNRKGQKNYLTSLMSFNYDSRVIFYMDKPS